MIFNEEDLLGGEDFYEIFTNKSNSSNISMAGKDVKRQNTSNIGSDRENKNVNSTGIPTFESLEYLMENMYPIRTLLYDTDDIITFEDTPFDGIAEEKTDAEQPEEATELQEDTGGDSGGSPFDNLTEDDGGVFGEENPEGEEEEKKDPVLSRKEAILNDTSISKAVRKKIPRNFLKLSDVISKNIDKIEKVSTSDIRIQNELKAIVDQLRAKQEYLLLYLKDIGEKTYDDIFAEYVMLYQDLDLLKESFIDLVGEEKEK